MTTTVEPTVNWSQDQMVEVFLNEPDDFLKVRETLTRIGVASRKEKKLYQSCHILHKQGKYYIVHFKELFALDGKKTNLSENETYRIYTTSRFPSCYNFSGFKTQISNMIVILFTALAVTNIIRFGMEQFTMEGFVSNGVELDELTNHLTEGSGLDTNKEELKKKEEDLENMEKEKISVEKTIKNMNLENKELNTNPKERDQTIDTLVKTITASNSVQMLERNMNFSQLELGKDKVNLALKYIDRIANEGQRKEVKTVLEIQLKLIDQLMTISPLINEFKDALKGMQV